MRRHALLASLSLLLLLPLLGAHARSARAGDPPTKGLRYPSLTPDNRSVVFAYRGDIWVAPVDGKGIARRLTIHEAQDTLPRVSPDGKQVAFSSRRDGGYDLFIVGIEGGLPRRVTFHGGAEILCDWSPDGKRLLFMTARGPSLTGMNLFEVSVDGGTPRAVVRDGGRDGSYHPDGKRVVYARGFVDIYWDNYEGSANFDLYTVEEPGALPVRLTTAPGNERYPAYDTTGDRIYFLAEENGVANMYARPAAGGARTQITAFKQDIWRPKLAWDRKTLVFEQEGRLQTADLTAEKPTAKPLPIVVKSDIRHSGIEERLVTTGPTQVHVSPGGDRLIFAVHGDLWMMPVGGGRATRLTDTRATEQWPRFSPDGQTIAYQTDKDGNSNVYLMDLKTKQSRPLITNKADDFFHAWSPDGTKLVYSSERSGNRDIWTVDVESGTTKQITRHPAPDDDPVFSPDGRTIAFDSGRGGTQAVYVMPADGSGKPRRVTQGTAFFQVPSFSPDSSMIVFEAFNQMTGRSGGLYVVATTGGPQVQLTRDGSAATWSPRGDFIYFTAERRGHSEIYRHAAPTSLDMSERVPFSGTIQVNLRAELGNLFDEIWEELYLGFYDPKMHGVDWKAMRKKYRDMAIDAEVKSEFHNVIRQMLAELGASHLGISGGNDTDSIVQPKLVETGLLGLHFGPDPAGDGGLTIVETVAGGPAEKAGLRVGDVVESLAGKPLKRSPNLDKLLAGTGGKDVKVRFRPLTAKGLGDPRTVAVVPILWRQMWDLTYRNWLAKNAKAVKTGTHGEVGYVHLLRMDGENLAKFQQAVARWNRNPKIKGMVLDIRNNGGGNIHQQLMQILTSKPFMQFKPRQKGDSAKVHAAKPKIPQPALYWEKPVVVLVNQRSFSDAEVFPHAFRMAGLGKLVGVRTAGGVIGTNDITLSDGSRLRIPRVGYYGMDGRTLEGDGVEPDFVVDLTPEDRREGRDPQMAKALEVIKGEVEAWKEAEKARKKAAREAKKQRAGAKAAGDGPKPKPGETPKKPVPPTTPAPKPPATPPSQSTNRNPLGDAEVGEWVRYRVRYGGSETVLKLEVSSVEDGRIHLVKTVEKGGAFAPPFPDEIASAPILEALAALGRTWDAAEGTATVQGRTFDVLDTMLEWEGTPFLLSFTNQVPALGLLAARLGDEVVLEAVDWSGRETEAPAAAKPAVEKPARTPAVPGAPKPPTDGGSPEPKPAEEGDASTPPFPNPAHDAEVGEWVRYRQIVPMGEIDVTLEVVEVDGDQMSVSATIRVGERTIDGPVSSRPRAEAYSFPEGVPSTWESESEILEIDGRAIECRVAALTLSDGTDIRIWISKEVPVTGLVKEERDGTLVRELTAWGTDGAPTE